jgi:hypothetical protein
MEPENSLRCSQEPATGSAYDILKQKLIPILNTVFSTETSWIYFLPLGYELHAHTKHQVIYTLSYWWGFWTEKQQIIPEFNLLLISFWL